MKATYITALEKQAAWLKWATSGKILIPTDDRQYAHVFPAYIENLRIADPIFMNAKFCDLVDHARMTVPDDLEFEESWMPTENGFLLLEEPFSVPKPVDLEWANSDIKIGAIGWLKVPEGYYFLCYNDVSQFHKGAPGFTCWSYFVLKHGQKVLDRVLEFEGMAQNSNIQYGGAYHTGRQTEMKHEIRWVFTALHVMAQKLTHTSNHPASPIARSMAYRKGLSIKPSLKVISLRRMEQDREASGESSNREYNWQWVVRGHWRKQPYKDDVIKNIFIEAYVKGPSDKPLKPILKTVFRAEK